MKNVGNRIIAAERLMILKWFFKMCNFSIGQAKILDVGCGFGETLTAISRIGARPSNLYGIDLLEDRIATARESLPDSSLFSCSATSLPYNSNLFDVALIFTVFSSIPESLIRRKVATECTRVVRHGGHIICRDIRFASYNRNITAISKDNVMSLFPGLDMIASTTSTPLPPLIRRLGHSALFAYKPLSRLRFLNVHNMILLRKP